MEGTKKGDKIAPSLAYVDVSALRLPMAVVYDHPADHPDAYVARIWDAIGPLMTDTIIFQSTLPRGERHPTKRRDVVLCTISIHAPARGATTWADCS